MMVVIKAVTLSVWDMGLCRASVTKGPTEKEQIDIQGDFQDDLAELVITKWKEVTAKDIYFMEKDRRTPYAS